MTRMEGRPPRRPGTHGMKTASFRWRSNVPAHAPSAFTLIEMLIVTAILGVVIAAIVACLAGGLRVWESARRFDKVETEAMFALAAVQKDVMNAIPFYALPFRGSPDGMAFPCLVSVLSGEGGEEVAVGTAAYRLDYGRGRLIRRAWAFPRPEPPEQNAETVAGRVRNARLWYAPDPADRTASGGAQWQDIWRDASNLPRRVRIDLGLDDEGETRTFSRTFVIPVVRPGQGGG